MPPNVQILTLLICYNIFWGFNKDFISLTCIHCCLDQHPKILPVFNIFLQCLRWRKFKFRFNLNISRFFNFQDFF